MDKKEAVVVTIEDARRGVSCVWHSGMKKFIVSNNDNPYAPRGMVPVTCGIEWLDKINPMGYILATGEIVLVATRDEIATARAYFANIGPPPVISDDSEDDQDSSDDSS